MPPGLDAKAVGNEVLVDQQVRLPGLQSPARLSLCHGRELLLTIRHRPQDDLLNWHIRINLHADRDHLAQLWERVGKEFMITAMK